MTCWFDLFYNFEAKDVFATVFEEKSVSSVCYILVTEAHNLSFPPDVFAFSVIAFWYDITV